ncbi:MAG: hypothetical protein ACYDAG_03140 [Chloroflexota bacterium]
MATDGAAITVYASSAEEAVWRLEHAVSRGLPCHRQAEEGPAAESEVIDLALWYLGSDCDDPDGPGEFDEGPEVTPT